MKKKTHVFVILMTICLIASFVGLIFLTHPEAETAFAVQEIQPTPGLGGLTPVEQETIQNYRNLLNKNDLDPDVRKSIEEKLQILESIADKRNESLQTGLGSTNQIEFPQVQHNPPIKTGIFEGDEGLFNLQEVIMQNYWQNTVDGNIVQVFAGGSASDPSQGVIYVVLTSFDRQGKEIVKLNTPERNGSVRIISEDGFVLSILADNGTKVIFDAKQLKFID